MTQAKVIWGESVKINHKKNITSVYVWRPQLCKSFSILCSHSVIGLIGERFNSYTWSALSFLYYQNIYILLAYAGREFQSEFSIYKISLKNQ